MSVSTVLNVFLSMETSVHSMLYLFRAGNKVIIAGTLCFGSIINLRHACTARVTVVVLCVCVCVCPLVGNSLQKRLSWKRCHILNEQCRSKNLWGFPWNHLVSEIQHFRIVQPFAWSAIFELVHVTMFCILSVSRPYS